MPASMNDCRSVIASKTRSSVIAACTIASGRSASSSSLSLVAVMPSSRPSSASSPTSLPAFAALLTQTPTSSRAGWASMPAIACRPMVPVDQTTTRSGCSGMTWFMAED
jgi:hypothetical protein